MLVAQAYHITTQLPDGRKSLLMDPGSVENLCGAKWAKVVAIEAHINTGYRTYNKRTTVESQWGWQWKPSVYIWLPLASVI